MPETKLFMAFYSASLNLTIKKNICKNILQINVYDQINTTFLWVREGCIGFPSSQYIFLTFNSKIWDIEMYNIAYIKWIVQFYVDFKIYKIYKYNGRY